MSFFNDNMADSVKKKSRKFNKPLQQIKELSEITRKMINILKINTVHR